uniref:TIL domain-containing protein n=1 Tax=Poecilia latipinna TaxID=48699 RepID=A0A3B3VC53_9TELE
MAPWQITAWKTDLVPLQPISVPLRIECPANSHYELCGTDCGHTCASSIDAACDHVCSEGCFCDEGFSRSGSSCVPVESCGCQYDGFYFNVG